TFFLRHQHHFELLLAEAPRLSAVDGPPRALRIWSAGCSTGEEAYSIAGTLRGRVLFDLIATDLNPESVDKARRGVYSGWSLRGRVELPDWLRPEADGVVVDPALRQQVRFEVLNLMDDGFPQGLDVIFCRNVLLYFSPARAQEVYQRFLAALNPGGLLIIADTDPTPPPSVGFEVFWRGQARAFRKPGVRLAAPPPPPTPPPPLPPPREALVVALATPVPLQAADQLKEGLAACRRLIGARRLDEARRILEGLLKHHPLEASPNLMLGLIAEEQGRRAEGIALARRALFLEPDAPFAHLLMGRLLRRMGEPDRARRHLLRAKDALSQGATPTECAPSEHELREMIYEQLRHL
ncbi:tetratricopeptide repeat protein, partial [Myxococcota bacterium]|nr:tetratricopeptide repeat protein [Myxococcota bacterium]